MNCAVRVGNVLSMVSMDRDQLRSWLRAVLMHKGWAGSDMAKAIGASASTINRFLNDPDATHSLSPRYLKAIEQATGFAPLMFPGMKAARGFAEPEAIAFDLTNVGDAAMGVAVRQFTKDNQSIDPWMLKSRALDAAGFFPGDVVLVDLSEKPRARDVVCAQVHDWVRDTAETVFRIYEPPYLIAATGNPDLMKPMLVDDDQVVIMGVVIQLLRPRRSAAVAA